MNTPTFCRTTGQRIGSCKCLRRHAAEFEGVQRRLQINQYR